jgi:hypothetical protein
MTARTFAALLATATVSLSSAARADDPRCNVPPYGGTVAEYKAFVANFGQYVVPARVLSSMCNMKFSGTPRTALYNLGFTDADIDAKDTEDLAVDMLSAARDLARKAEPPN